jgi:hypothetical protein
MAFEARFAEIFDFTDDELRANRAGQISPRQKFKLGKEDTQETLDIGCALFILLSIAFITLVLCGLLFDISAYIRAFVDGLPFIIPVVLLLAGIIFYVNHLGRRERRQKYPMPVTALRGDWRLEVIEGRAYDRYYLLIDGLRLKILMNAYDVLRTLDPATPLVVYIESASQKIVAMEIADEE